MSYQEFQRAQWKDLREKGGVADCFRLGDDKIAVGIRIQVIEVTCGYGR